MTEEKKNQAKCWTDLLRKPKSREPGKPGQGREGVDREMTKPKSTISHPEPDKCCPHAPQHLETE